MKTRIVPEQRAPFFVRWVRKFISQAPAQPAVSLQDRISVFLDNLAPEVKDWQLEQAERAVRLYFFNFLSESKLDMAPASGVTPDADGTVRKCAVLEAMRNLIRLRHYSYRTEQTYVEWAARFFRYLDGRGCSTECDRYRFTGREVREFLAYLAVKDCVPGKAGTIEAHSCRWQ